MNLFSLARIKKNVNNLLVSDWLKLFPTEGMTVEELLAAPAVKDYVTTQLKLCKDQTQTPETLLTACIDELSQKCYIALEGPKVRMLYNDSQLCKFVFDIVRGVSDGSDKGLSFDEVYRRVNAAHENFYTCLLYTSPSPRDATLSRMPSSA